MSDFLSSGVGPVGIQIPRLHGRSRRVGGCLPEPAGEPAADSGGMEGLGHGIRRFRSLRFQFPNGPAGAGRMMPLLLREIVQVSKKPDI